MLSRGSEESPRCAKKKMTGVSTRSAPDLPLRVYASTRHFSLENSIHQRHVATSEPGGLKPPNVGQFAGVAELE